jgi:surface antigen
MRPSECLSTLAATVFTAMFMVAMIFMASDQANASDPNNVAARIGPGPDLRSLLDDNDELATLDAVHTALTQVGDGSSYIWHRHNGRISAVLQPTQSFKREGGQVCRHLVVMLMSGTHTRKTAGIACRLEDGRWQLNG